MNPRMLSAPKRVVVYIEHEDFRLAYEIPDPIDVELNIDGDRGRSRHRAGGHT